jgi:hypothetical protein
MRRHLGIPACLLLNLAVFSGPASAQTKQTASTLKLDAADHRAKAAIGDLRWLQGYWVGEGLGGTAEEIWSRPVGNSMMGSFRLVKGGKVLFHELCTIVEEDGSLVLKLKHFDAQLNGWEEKDKALNFPLVKRMATEAFFDGITFRKMRDGSLIAYVAIENKKTGKVREEAFTYHPLKENSPTSEGK